MPVQMIPRRARVPVVAALAALASAGSLSAQTETRHVSVSWSDVPIAQVLRAFAAYSGVSIVAGANVAGTVTADINDQPWDVALDAILSVNGFAATEDAYGIIRVESLADLDEREAVEPLLTRSYRISYSTAAEMQAAIAPLLSARGSAAVAGSSNTLIVSDISRVQRSVRALLR